MFTMSGVCIYEKPSSGAWPVKLETLPLSNEKKSIKKKRKTSDSSSSTATFSASRLRKGSHSQTRVCPTIVHSSSSQTVYPPSYTRSSYGSRMSCDSSQKQQRVPPIRKHLSGIDQTLSSVTTRQISSAPSSTQDSVITPAKKRVPLLTAIKPENEKPEKERFLRAINYQYNPGFIYRNPADPEILDNFSKPSGVYLRQAILIMETALKRYRNYENFEEETGGIILTRPQIVSSVQKYIKKEDLKDEIQLNLSEEMLSRGSMTKVKGKPTLNVRIVNLREFWVDGLLRHEVGTHYLRSCNNRNQVWANWKRRRELGMKPLNPTEEGLASIHSVLLRKDPCMWRSALLYYTTYMAAFLSFKELFKDLGKFVKDPHVRWDYCMRAKRGQVDTSIPGTFCKDQVYLEGALDLLKNRKSIDFQL